MRVLGVDPGYDRLGVALLEYVAGRECVLYSDCITTPKHAELSERLYILGTTFQSLLHDHKPDTVAIETIFFNKNQKTAVGVAQARGIIIYLARSANCTVYEFGPQEVKVAVTGHGTSNKRAVIEMVKRLTTNSPNQALDDEYDAIAVAMTCLAHHGRGR